MAYVEAHAGLRDHLKTKKVARLLGVPKVQVIGHKCLQNNSSCAMMSSSEQVLETHGIATTTGVFCCPKKHTCSAQSAPSIDHAATANACVATWVSSLDERRTLRVPKQEMHPYA